MHTYVYCGTIHNSKDLEPTQMSINDRLDKENATHILVSESETYFFFFFLNYYYTLSSGIHVHNVQVCYICILVPCWCAAPIKGRLDEENVAYIHHGILCSHKKG